MGFNPPLEILAAVAREESAAGGRHEGYLVIEPGELRLVGFAFTGQGRAAGLAHQVALAIKADPASMDRMGASLLDLRGRGDDDSRRPVPAFLYGLRYTIAGPDGGFDPSALATIVFYCPILAAALEAARAKRTERSIDYGR